MSMNASVPPRGTMSLESPAAPLNLWYMGAWGSEVTEQPMARRILATPVVFFRGESGQVAALQDRCCHRAAPLSLGRVKGDTLQCGYHGLCFDRAGKCVRVPGQDLIPPAAQVRSYPIVEQDGAVWIWMGDPALADVGTVPRFPRHADPKWHWRGEHFAYATNQVLLYDNLMDLTHVGYIHPNTIGGNEEDHSSAEMMVERSDLSAKGVRWMRDVEPPAAYQALRPFLGRIDRCQVIRFQPGLVTISIVAHDAGRLQSDDDAMDGYESHGFHAITPETDSSCHYFWAVGVPERFMQPGLLEKKIELTRVTFEEDREMLEAQFRNMQEFTGMPVISVRSDALSMAARRIWSSLAEQELSQGRQPAGHDGMQL